MIDTPDRPAATGDLTAEEFLRWYWLRSELAAFACELGLSTGGGKRQLTDRIVERLATGRSAAVADTGRSAAPGPGRGRRRSASLLPEPVHSTTVVPPGQPCSQQLRAWFRTQIGPRFTFDAHMREFFATADGTTTLGDAVQHWHATRGQRPSVIGPQFEFNQFSRDWHEANPACDRSELLAAWATYRNTPRPRGRAGQVPG